MIRPIAGFSGDQYGRALPLSFVLFFWILPLVQTFILFFPSFLSFHTSFCLVWITSAPQTRSGKLTPAFPYFSATFFAKTAQS